MPARPASPLEAGGDPEVSGGIILKHLLFELTPAEVQTPRTVGPAPLSARRGRVEDGPWRKGIHASLGHLNKLKNF